MATTTLMIKRVKIEQGRIIDREDHVARDSAICIFINGEFYRTLIATPENERQLVQGHLWTEGVLDNMGDLTGLEVHPLRVEVGVRHEVDLLSLTLSKSKILTTACGALGAIPEEKQLGDLWNPSKLRVNAGVIWELMLSLHSRSKVYRETGGTHSALLGSREGEVLAYAGDVGRHNAVDKVVGIGLDRDVDFSMAVLLSSGRLSGEVVLKAARSGIPVIASVSGPLESGVNIARVTGLTLIGFVRGGRMNVYTNPERIVL